MDENRILKFILGWPRSVKQLVQVATDFVLLSICYFTLLAVFSVSLAGVEYLYLWAVLAGVFLLSLSVLKVYSAIVRYINPSMLFRLGIASVCSTFAAYALSRTLQLPLPERFFMELGLLVAAFALLPRMLFAQLVHWRDSLKATKVAIYGAGSAGRQLYSAFEEGRDYRVIAFLDDRRDLQSTYMHGIPVWPLHKVRKLVSAGLEEVQLAIPGASKNRRKEIILELESCGLKIKTVPPLRDILSGKAQLADLRQVSPEDLLGRDPVPPIAELMDKNIKGKTVMVTGAGGTVGGQLCREIIRRQPGKLVLFDVSEHALYSIDSELRDELEAIGTDLEIIPALGPVGNEMLVSQVLTRNEVDTVFHAAAYKHVPMVEANALQGMWNNAVGTWVFAGAALEAGVSAFVLVSTDKAVRPTNIMGASKRIAELCVRALAADRASSDCVFSIVRFGNVLDSSGSVIPRFRQQIRNGGPVTVTHRDMIRYFMTVEEAAQLVIQAGAMGQRGEVFVLDMGEPVNIYELAQRKIRLLGLELKTPENPDGDVEIRVTGPRPGEKLYEELLIDGAQPTNHPRIYMSDEPGVSMHAVRRLMSELNNVVKSADENGLVRVLQSFEVLHYQPENAVTVTQQRLDADAKVSVEPVPRREGTEAASSIAVNQSS